MVLARPRFSFSVEDQIHFIEGIKKYGTPIKPSPSNAAFTDESDRVFYEAAKSADTYLVTGNAKHCPVEPFILSPAECVDLLSRSIINEIP